MPNSIEPRSELTLTNPRLWLHAIETAKQLTGYEYLDKQPSSDGIIYACYGGGGYSIYSPAVREELERPKSESEKKQERIDEIDEEIESHEIIITDLEIEIEEHKESTKKNRRTIKDTKLEIEKLKKERDTLVSAPIIRIPEGDIEWLLHEIGHYIAATNEERNLPNYGFNGNGIDLIEDQTEAAHHAYLNTREAFVEWSAWAFEEIVLAPFGNARQLCQPSCRDGIAFARHVDIPDEAFKHIELKIKTESIDVEMWRSIAADWFSWGRRKGIDAPWSRIN